MIATTLEQSRKLVELCISTDTADLFATSNGAAATFYICGSDDDAEKCFPAWSLEALMNTQPYLMELVKSKNNRYRCNSETFSSEWHSNSIDAVIEIIERKYQLKHTSK